MNETLISACASWNVNVSRNVFRSQLKATSFRVTSMKTAVACGSHVLNRNSLFRHVELDLLTRLLKFCCWIRPLIKLFVSWLGKYLWSTIMTFNLLPPFKSSFGCTFKLNSYHDLLISTRITNFFLRPTSFLLSSTYTTIS
jgi:hypothetical protein